MPAVHAGDEIARFIGDGERRLIAAAYRDRGKGGELFVMPEGQAKELREWAKHSLRCMFATCATPGLTTVHRRGSRDGFRHLAGRASEHAPESEWHLLGKAVLAEHLRQRHPGSTIEVEVSVETQRRRTPDVLATAATGERIAIEVQYAALTPDEWEARHADYLAAGVVDVWLWGHEGAQLRHARGSWLPGDVTLTPAQQAARDAGLPLLWINPETRQIAVGVDGAIMLGSPRFRHARLRVAPLEVYSLTTDGLNSPLLGELRAQRKRELAEAAESARRADEAAAREATEREARIARQVAIEAARDAEWERKLAEYERKRSEEPAVPFVAERAGPDLGPWTCCRTCGMKLDPILERVGYHVACKPGFRFGSRS